LVSLVAVSGLASGPGEGTAPYIRYPEANVIELRRY